MMEYFYGAQSAQFASVEIPKELLTGKAFSSLSPGAKLMYAVLLSELANTLEAHHIIPLGSVTKVDESTDKLRNDDKNICNSPTNFVYITKKSNDEITDASLDEYITKITDEAKAALHIQSYTSPNIDADNTKQILRQRYSAIKGDIKNHVRQLLL